MTHHAPRTILTADSYAAGSVLWVNNSLCCGGVERQLTTSAQALRHHGVHTLKLLCTSLAPQANDDFFLPKVQDCFEHIYLVNELPQHTLNELLPLALKYTHIAPWLDQQESYALVMYIAWMLHIRPRCVHSWHGDWPLAALAACIAGVPRVILSGRSLSPRSRTPLGLEGPNVEKTHLTYTLLSKYPACTFTNNSHAGIRDYARWLECSPEQISLFTNVMPITTVPEAATLELKQHIGVPTHSKVISGAFRFVSIKDPLLWIAAAQNTCERVEDTVAVLWGDGPMYAQCQQLVASKGLTDKILLPGNAKDGMLALSIADVVLMTSKVEGMPNVLLEAQSLGIPVVTTQAGGAEDTFVHGRSGWLVPHRTADDLAERLAFVLTCPPWANKVAAHARQHLIANFSIEQNMARLTALYGSPGNPL